MARGDHFFVWRQFNGIPFQHHAIDLGDGSVVHFTDGDGGVAGPGGAAERFEVQRTSLDSLTRGAVDSIHVVQHASQLPADLVVRRAMSQIGRRDYHLLLNNCEHFACWCVAGRQSSRQVDLVCERLGATSVKAIAAGTARIVSKIKTGRAVRGAHPWILVADAAQLITETAGHHVGIRNPQHRKYAGRAVGMTTALTMAASGGPAGILIAGSLWAAGELAGEVSRAGCERVRGARSKERGALSTEY